MRKLSYARIFCRGVNIITIGKCGFTKYSIPQKAPKRQVNLFIISLLHTSTAFSSPQKKTFGLKYDNCDSNACKRC